MRALQFFTDGSSVRQEDPLTRYSGFAMVVDLADSLSEREYHVREWFANQVTPATLVTVLKSRLSGLQGIHRAELSAIVLIIEQFDRCLIWKDSQVAIAAFELGSTAQSPRDFADHPFFELVLRIYKAARPGHRVSKIKAHQTPTAEMEVEDVYRILGNQLADQEAKSTIHMIPVLQQEHDNSLNMLRLNVESSKMFTHTC